MKRLFAAALAAVLAISFPQKPESVPDAPFSVEAKSFILMEASTGQVLAGKEIHRQLAMASTTKIMTALITLEQPDLDEFFTVDADAIRVEGSSMGLLPGDSVTLRTLAAGMLLSSGNDGANAAAVKIAGSVPAFVEKMNLRAKEMGLSDTSFETPSGLDGENHYSTAYDMAVLACNALQNADFAAICGQEKLQVSYGQPPYGRTLTNHNRLLASYESCIGVKTGFTQKAGRCLVSAARREGVTLICVSLAAADDWNLHRKILDWGFSQLEQVDLSEQLWGLTVPVAGETKPLAVRYAGETKAVIPTGEAENIRTELLLDRFYYRPLFKEQKIGEARFYLNGQLLCTADLFPQENLPLPQEHKPKIRDLFRRLLGDGAPSNLTP